MQIKPTIRSLLNDYPKTIWLICFSVLTIAIVVTYFYLHQKFKGEEQVLLKPQQINTINSFINNDKDTLNVKKLIVNYLDAVLPQNKTDIQKLVNTYDFKQLIIILPTYPFTVNSYFWLSGTCVLLEVVFWSLFGLFAGLMQGVTLAKEFKAEIVYEHIGKIFYTPFVCIIIYLSLNALLNNGSVVFIDVGKSVIVLSFLLGFFTRRSILLLVKVKDLILPKGKETEEQDKNMRRKTFDDMTGTVNIVGLSEKEKELHIENARISLTSIESGVEILKHPDKYGFFTFKKVRYGDYKMKGEIDVNGYRYSNEAYLTINEKTGSLEIKFNLRKE